MPRRPPPRQHASLASAVVCVALALVVVLVSASTARAGSSYFTSSTNSARASNGESAYAVASDLTAIAQRHAESMASSRSLYHNSSLGSEACCWRSIGENVGEGPSDSSVQNAFMNSSSHRANILSSTFTEIGVGTAQGSDGQVYVDEVFRARSGSSGSSHVSPPKAPISHYTTSSRTPVRYTHTIARPAAPRPPSAATLLRRRLHLVAAVRGRPVDPVAAALSFNVMMARLTH